MMKKMAKGAIIGGLVLFAWGMLSWAVLPLQKDQMRNFKDGRQVAQVIQDNAPVEGVYILNKGADSAVGPSVFATVSYERTDGTVKMIESLVCKIVLAFLVTWLMLQTKLNDKKRVGFITVVGVTIALACSLPHVIWCGFPTGFTLAMIVDTVIGWALAGAVIAKVAK